MNRRNGLENPTGTLWLALAIAMLWTVSAEPASATLPMDRGEASATCSSSTLNGNQNPGNPVASLKDVRSPQNRGANWLAPSFWNQFPNTTMNLDDEWVNRNLGEVFGTVLDGDPSAPNIYVTATSVYGYTTADLAGAPYGPRGPGAVYRLDGTTGAICVVTVLPDDEADWTTGPQPAPGAPSLGDIAYDSANDQFFVSNLDDGLVYRIQDDTSICTNPHQDGPDSGPWIDTFDHLGPDSDPTPLGLPDFGERVFGLAVWNGRLYYGVWVENRGVGFTDPLRDNEVWSVPLDGSGVPIAGSEVLEFDVDDDLANNATTTMPVAGISFSNFGNMFVSERSIKDAFSRTAHYSGAQLFENDGSDNFSRSPTRDFFVGTYGSGKNSAGGSDFLCDESVWSTGDALLGTTIYGLQRTPAVGNTDTALTFTDETTPSSVATSSFFVDLNGVISSQDKTRIGDISLFRDVCDDTDEGRGGPCSSAFETPPDTVGWWSLDEPLGLLAATADLAGGHHAVYHGPIAPGPEHVAGTKTFPAATTAVAKVADPSDGSIDFPSGQEFSIDGWVKIAAPSGIYTHPIAWKLGCDTFLDCATAFGNTFDVGYAFAVSQDGRLVLHHEYVLHVFTTSSNVVPVFDDEWHHVAVTVDPSGSGLATFYFDGAQVGTSAAPMHDMMNTRPLQIGNGPQAFGGSLDEVQIIRRKLDASEVLWMYNADGCKYKEQRRPECGVGLDMISIGKAGNPDDNRNCSYQPDGHTLYCGGVSDPYLIGRCEVTNAQYTDFLNSVDPFGSNPNGIYDATATFFPDNPIKLGAGRPGGSKYYVAPDLHNHPVAYVHYEDTARFANWLHAGAPDSGPVVTESGAYDMAVSPAIREVVARYFVPNVDEWYKAAYHASYTPVAAPQYTLFPTQSHGMSCVVPPGGIVSANCDSAFGATVPVGTYKKSRSYWGTINQAGNVREITESPILPGATDRRILGASFSSSPCLAQSTFTQNGCPTGLVPPFPPSNSGSVGFRIAGLPDCYDFVDNDTDFVIDGMDPGCEVPEEDSEVGCDADTDGVISIDDFRWMSDFFDGTLGENFRPYFEYDADCDTDETVGFPDLAILAEILTGNNSSAGGTSEIRLEPATAKVAPGSFIKLELVADLPDPVIGFGFECVAPGLADPDCPFVEAAGWGRLSTEAGSGFAAARVDSVSGSDVVLGSIVMEAPQTGSFSAAIDFAPGDVTQGLGLDDGSLGAVVLIGASIEVTTQTDTWRFAGVAQGGSIDFNVNGVELSVATVVGETAAQTAVRVADAINAEPALILAGSNAIASGGSVTLIGEVSDVVITDPGINHAAVPSLGIVLRLGMAALMAASGVGLLSRRRRG